MSQESLYLENKKILTVSGLNCVDFLNNILTSDISKLTPLETRPSALLSPQGRVLYDILVSLDFQNSSKEKSILIEHDLFCEDDLIKKLNIYNLRKDVKIEKTNYYVHVSTNPECSENSLKDKRFSNTNININIATIIVFDSGTKKSIKNLQVLAPSSLADSSNSSGTVL